VAAQGSGSAPTGSVQFVDTVTHAVLASATLTAGAASAAIPAVSEAGHSLAATYSGDDNFLSSTTPPADDALDPEWRRILRFEHIAGRNHSGLWFRSGRDDNLRAFVGVLAGRSIRCHGSDHRQHGYVTPRSIAPGLSGAGEHRDPERCRCGSRHFEADCFEWDDLLQKHPGQAHHTGPVLHEWRRQRRCGRSDHSGAGRRSSKRAECCGL